MEAFLKKLDAFVAVFARAGLWISGIILFAIILLVAAEVICRTFLGISLFVVEELVGYLLAAFTVFGLSHTFRSGNILRVEILYSQLSRSWQARVELAFNLFALVYLFILEYQLIRLVSTSYRREITSVTLMAFPVWIPQALIALGGAILTVTLLNAILSSGWRLAVGRAPSGRD